MGTRRGVRRHVGHVPDVGAEAVSRARTWFDRLFDFLWGPDEPSLQPNQPTSMYREPADHTPLPVEPPPAHVHLTFETPKPKRPRPGPGRSALMKRDPPPPPPARQLE